MKVEVTIGKRSIYIAHCYASLVTGFSVHCPSTFNLYVYLNFEFLWHKCRQFYQSHGSVMGFSAKRKSSSNPKGQKSTTHQPWQFPRKISAWRTPLNKWGKKRKQDML